MNVSQNYRSFGLLASAHFDYAGIVILVSRRHESILGAPYAFYDSMGFLLNLTMIVMSASIIYFYYFY